jgi:molybdopterin-guanine dinucleotide biosynthesis protein A
LPDSLPDYPGPLAGLLAGMQAAPDAVADAALRCRLCRDFAARLLAALPGRQAVSASDPAMAPQPAGAASRAATLAAGLSAAGGRSIRGWLAGLQHDTVQFAQPFANLNTLAAVQQLEQQWPAD